MFKDLKEIWCWGKQEVRLLKRNEAATAMNMLLFTITELATWDRTQEELVDRSCSPWDDASRRPSHSDRRNFLRQAILMNELNTAIDWNFMPTKIVALLKKLMKLAV